MKIRGGERDCWDKGEGVHSTLSQSGYNLVIDECKFSLVLKLKYCSQILSKYGESIN